jgi:hypothetical protein
MYRRDRVARNGIPATEFPQAVESALPPKADMYRVGPSVGSVG